MPVNAESRKSSREIFNKLKEKIPGGVNSPVRAFTGLELDPLVARRGEGDTLWDQDDNAYVDYCGSWGPLILGHAHPVITAAIAEQVSLGSTFGATTALELALATKITTHMPSIEKIRFVSSGTEATMSALRLARGYTGRTLFLKFDGNYHGHADTFLSHTDSVTLPYNDTAAARAFLQKNKVAAVILEPIAGNMGLIPATPTFLSTLREETQKQGALLIFDEVITGFRVGLGGAQALYSITPDLTCLGKIIGGGLPAAAFGGRADIMDHLAPHGPIFQAGTLSGCPAAMRAGLETLTLLETPHTYETLREKTTRITRPIQEWIASHDSPLCIHTLGSCFTLFFGPTIAQSKDDLKTLDQSRFKHFYHYLFERGIFFPPSPYETAFVSLAHTKKHLEMTGEIVVDYLQRFLR